ncbi:MAG: DNA polymerase III subunit delta' [Clostridia bacterium]|nr:DNA polymerase III subunit delta' [Clostridia bacterium]
MPTIQPTRLRTEDFRTQSAAWQLLTRDMDAGTVPHALLITGNSGTGKRSLASLTAQILLCTGEKKPCGTCPACLQMATGNHPDALAVRPGEPLSPKEDKGKKTIPVSDIRILNELAVRRAQEGGWRVFVIEQAEAMTDASANALLKTLEEPPENVCFMLLTDRPDALLPTIVSRCRTVALHPWADGIVAAAMRAQGVPEQRTAQILPLAMGSVGMALTMAQDEGYWALQEKLMRHFFGMERRSQIPAISDEYRESRGDSDRIFDILEDMVRNLLLVRLGRAPVGLLDAYPPIWRKAAAEADYAAFVRLQDAIMRTRKMRESAVTWQVILEQLLLKFMEERSQWSIS